VHYVASPSALIVFPPCAPSVLIVSSLVCPSVLTAGADIVIMARTDARSALGLDEAITRCQRFREIGADITFLEAPLSEEEMIRYCKEVS
jgi:hypothetical protein